MPHVDVRRTACTPYVHVRESTYSAVRSVNRALRNVTGVGYDTCRFAAFHDGALYKYLSIEIDDFHSFI